MKSHIYKLGMDLMGNIPGFTSMFIGTIDSRYLKSFQAIKSEYTKFTVLDEIQTKIFHERYERENAMCVCILIY